MAEEKVMAPEAEEPKATKKPAAKKAAEKPAAEKKPAAKKPAAKKPAAEKKAAEEKPAAAKKPAAKKAPAKKPAAKKAEKTGITIKLVKGFSGRKDPQIATAKSLGLKKIGDITVQPDNAATHGKIAKISHMVEVIKA